jgi:hypothetical protein
VKSRKFCPVGKLLPGMCVLVMDDQLNVNPVGVRGQVCVRSTFNTKQKEMCYSSVHWCYVIAF